MPTYREKVYICPEQNGQPVLIMAFPFWWQRSEFFNNFGHRLIDTGNPIYVDYGLLLTGSEAREWDARCKIVFASDPRSKEPFFVEAMQRWEEWLEAATWVIIESYEWESGLS